MTSIASNKYVKLKPTSMASPVYEQATLSSPSSCDGLFVEIIISDSDSDSFTPLNCSLDKIDILCKAAFSSDLSTFSKKLFKEEIIYKSLKTDIFILAVSHKDMLYKINKNINIIKSNNKNLILVDLTSKLSLKADISF